MTITDKQAAKKKEADQFVIDIIDMINARKFSKTQSIYIANTFLMSAIGSIDKEKRNLVLENSFKILKEGVEDQP